MRGPRVQPATGNGGLRERAAAFRATRVASAVLAQQRSAELVALDEALRHLESAQPRQGRVVELASLLCAHELPGVLDRSAAEWVVPLPADAAAPEADPKRVTYCPVKDSRSCRCGHRR